jgi:zinc protease
MRARSAASLLVALALALSSLGCDPPGVKGLGIKLDLTKKKLSNGLTVILVEDHTVPVVSYQSWFRVGSVDEELGYTGISHLFEHLMFKGTPRYGAKQFFEQLEARGAQVNAMTTRDYTVYYQNFIPDLLEKVIDMESDRMANLILNEETLQSERNVVFEERRLRTENTPEGKMQEALWSLAFKRHPYQWPVIGYPQDLMAINVEMLKDWFKVHYQPANATIVVVGDIDAGETLKLLRKYYEKIPGRPRPEREIPEEPEQKEERRLEVTDAVSSERFAQAYHVTSATQDDSYSLDVLANILFEGTASRAYRRMVEELDIVAGVSGSAYTPTYPGLFTITGIMKGDLPSSRAEAELDRLLSEVQDDVVPVAQDEIQRAVRQLTVQLVDSVRTPYGVANLIGLVQTIFEDPYRFANDLGKYQKVSADDVKRVALKYMIPNNRSVVTIRKGPSAKAEPIEGLDPATAPPAAKKAAPRKKPAAKPGRKKE